MHAVICEDRSRQLNVGTIIEGPNEIQQMKNRGAVCLPYDIELPRLANTGHVQTFYGNGWLFNQNAGERGCPMMINITKACRVIYWAARIEAFDAGVPISLKIRLVHSSANQRGLGRGMNQLEHVVQTPVLNSNGFAIVQGKTGFTTEQEGFLFTDLYAVGSNCCVMWCALSQHRQDLRWSAAG